VVSGRTLGLLGFASAAVGGVGFGLLARQRTADFRRELDADPEWLELQRPLGGRALHVTSFDGTVLHAEVTGRDGAPTIVLAHGYALTLQAWHYQRRDLSDEFRVVAYDQRGHGRSGRAVSSDYSIAALGRDLAAVLAAVSGRRERVVVAGHSLGGMSLLSFAQDHPREVRRRLAGAVFLDTTGSDVLAGGLVTTGVAVASVLPRSALQRGLPLLRRGGPVPPGEPQRGPVDLTTLITRAVGFGPDPKAGHVAFVEQLAVDTPNSVKADLGPTLTALDLRDAPSSITVPALVMVGSHDRLTPPAAAARLSAALPDARLVVLQGSGHNAMLEAAEQVTGELRAFARARFARVA